MRGAAVLGAAALALTTAACATRGGGEAAAAADLPAVAPANARAQLYAACLGDAERRGGEAVQRFGRLLRMTCTGAPAAALFDAADVFTQTRGWAAVEADGGAVRRFSPRSYDDQCRRLGAETTCRIHVPVGDFLFPERDATPPK